jgi:3-oxoacyl-[acyl-carrier-protein] synthase III
MSVASEEALRKAGLNATDVSLLVPHQANLRIIEAVAKRSNVPMEKVFLTVQRYGNMSSATVPVALVDALEEGRVEPNSLVLAPGFGAGLTWAAHVIRWGSRVKPLGFSDIELPPCDKSAVELVQDIIRRKGNTTKGLDVQLPTR